MTSVAFVAPNAAEVGAAPSFRPEGARSTRVGEPVAESALTASPSYQAVPVTRLFDTRGDAAAEIQVPIGKIGRGVPLEAAIGGAGGIPESGVAAVDLNIAVTAVERTGFLAVYPCADGNDGTARLNYTNRPELGASAIAVQVLAQLDADGKVCIDASSPAHVIVDTSGYLPEGGPLNPVPAKRLFDTRTGDGEVAVTAAKPARSTPFPIEVAGVAGVPESGAAAVLLSVAAVKGTAPGFVSVFPCADGYQGTANLNHRRDDPVANSVIAPVDENGEICFYNSASVDLVVDISAWFAVDAGFGALEPSRAADTRDGTGGIAVAKLTPMEPLPIQLAGVGGVPDEGVEAVSLNVAVARGAAPGFLAIFPCDEEWNGTASLNFQRGEPISNAALTPIAGDGTACVLASQPVDVIIDVNGWLGSEPTAIDDDVTIAEDSGINQLNVLGNDIRTTQVTAITQPENGSVAITNSGDDVRFIPPANYCTDGPLFDLDPETFTYSASPGDVTATVAVTITCVDDDPVAVDDAFTIAEDAPAETFAPLANDTDIDLGPITIDSVTQPANGAVAITNGGADISYAPDPDYCNDESPVSTDDFTYTLAPGGDTAAVAMTVMCVNDAPVAVPDSFTSDDSTPGGPNDRNAIGNTRLRVGGTPSGVPERSIVGSLLDNDADVDSSLTVVGVQMVTGSAPFTASTSEGGSVTVAADGTFVYDPAVGFTGTDMFTYTISDGVNPVDDGEVTIEVVGTVWYVDSNVSNGSVGSGSALDPFSHISDLNGVSADVDGVGDTIFLFEGDGSPAYFGGMPLLADQQLIGEPSGLIVDGSLLVPADPGFPVLGNNGASITLADGVRVDGVATTNSSGVAILGDGVGDVELNDIAHTGFATHGIQLIDLAGPVTATGTVTIDGATSQAGVAITDSLADGDVTFETLVIANSTDEGLELNGNAGDVAVGAGAIDASATFGLDITGGSGAVSVGADIGLTASNGGAVRVFNRTGGAVSIGGEIYDSAGGVIIGGTSNTGTNIGSVTFAAPVTLETVAGSPGDGPGLSVSGPLNVSAGNGAMTVDFDAMVRIEGRRAQQSLLATADSSWPIATQTVNVNGGLEIATGATTAQGVVGMSGTLNIADAPGVGETISTHTGQPLSLDGTSGTLEIDLLSSNASATPIQASNPLGASPQPITHVDIESVSVIGNDFNTVYAVNVDSFRIGGGTVAAGTTGGGARGLHLSGIPDVDVTLAAVTVASDGFNTSAVLFDDIEGAVHVDALAVDDSANGIIAMQSAATISFDTVDIGDPGNGVTGRGVLLGGNTGTITIGSGDITSAAGSAFYTSGGTADITYGGTITNSTGVSVEDGGRVGGTLAFTGPITHTGTSTGVQSQFNVAPATLRFSGGLDITTTNATAFRATSGGVLEVLEPAGGANTLHATGGSSRTLDLSVIDIGAGGATFTTISGSSVSAGIHASSVQGPGTLTVTGTGSASSGGVISSPSGDGVTLLTVNAPVVLQQMSVTNPGQRLVSAENAADVTLESFTGSSAGGAEAVRATSTTAGTRSVTWTGTPTLRSSYVGDGTEVALRSFATNGAHMDVTADHLDLDAVLDGIFVSTAGAGTLDAAIGDPGAGDDDAPTGSAVDRVTIDGASRGAVFADALGGPLSILVDEARIDGGAGLGVGLSSPGFAAGPLDAVVEDTIIGTVTPVGGDGINVGASDSTQIGRAYVKVSRTTSIGVDGIEAGANSGGVVDLTVEASTLTGSSRGMLVTALGGGGAVCLDANGSADPALENAIGGTPADVDVARGASETIELEGLGAQTLPQWFDGGNADGNDADPLEIFTNPGWTPTDAACTEPTIP